MFKWATCSTNIVPNKTIDSSNICVVVCRRRLLLFLSSFCKPSNNVHFQKYFQKAQFSLMEVCWEENFIERSIIDWHNEFFLDCFNFPIEMLSSILLPADNSLKLCDFGTMREWKGATTSMTYCGTVGYMAPEVLQGERYSYKVWYLWYFLFSISLKCDALQ